MIFLCFASGANIFTSLKEHKKRIRASESLLLESHLGSFSHTCYSFPSVVLAHPSIKLSSALSFAPPAVWPQQRCPRPLATGAELSNVPLRGALKAFHWQQISIWGEDLFLVFFPAFKERGPRSNWGHVPRSPFPAESALLTRSHTQRIKRGEKIQ